jgi:hypothetical protein
MTVLVVVLAVLVVGLAGALIYRSRPPRQLRAPRDARRILVPFTGGNLDPTVLSAAIRIARADDAVLVPAYLLVVPLEYSEDSPLTQQVEVAVPLLEAVENAALRCGVPVDARIEKGRTPTHALGRLWDIEKFDRVIAPAPVQSGGGYGGGFTPNDLTWILTHAPTETLVLKPNPAVTAASSAASPSRSSARRSTRGGGASRNADRAAEGAARTLEGSPREAAEMNALDV